jgi:gamma-glutamylputrescine oxidase
MNLPTTLSFWERDSFFNNIDVAIIGSGIVGLSTALALRERDATLRIAVIERGTMPTGASTRNAGFACFGSITELLDDLEHHSEDTVFSLVEQRFRGLSRLRQRVGDANMNYEAYGGFEIFKHTPLSIFEKCADSLSYFNKKISSIVGCNDNYQVLKQGFGFKNVLPNMIWNKSEGQIDTGRMMTTLLRLAQEQNILIFNGLKINTITDDTVGTSRYSRDGVILETEDGWDFKVRKVVVATNGFAQRLMPHLEVTPARNQVLITKPIPHLAIKGGFHYDKGYFYFRNVGNRLLLGGGRNLAISNEMTDAFGTTELIQNALKQLLTEVILPDTPFEIDTWWSGILGIGNQKKPIIERVSPNVVVAVRMGGMGVAIGSLVGEEAAALVDI